MRTARRFMLPMFLILGSWLTANAENVTVEFYKTMPEDWRLVYVIGYVEGFAVAEGAGALAKELQKCFGNWSNAETKTVFDLWVRGNPDKESWTARVALYSAIAEAFGWKRTGPR